MARSPRSAPTAEEAFLAPLATLALRAPEIEGLVFWEADGWAEEPTEVLESEEIAFYVEGLLPEGFQVEWRIIALEGEGTADHIRLYIQEAGSPPPAEGEGWQVLNAARWPKG